MPSTGTRGRTPVSPTNRTGAIYAAQLREKRARDAAKNVDDNEVRRTEYLRGHSDGYAKGLGDGWDACIRALVAEGLLDPDEPDDAPGNES